MNAGPQSTVASSDAFAATNCSSALFVRTACGVVSVNASLLSCSAASTTRNMPGSCTVHVNVVPLARRTLGGHVTLPKVKPGYDVDIKRAISRRAGAVDDAALDARAAPAGDPCESTIATAMPKSAANDRRTAGTISATAYSSTP